MSESIVFQGFPKIARLSRDIIVTEKLDGTNAQIYIADDNVMMKAGSKSRWLEPGQTDNFGFARWVEEHREELLQLGPGRHFGEWWGQGIQRRYGMNHKTFSLFNTSRWSNPEVRPACCNVVPVLYDGLFDMNAIEGCLLRLRNCGSVAAPGFTKPEGIVVFHTAGGYLFKKTLEHDEKPKGKVEE